MKKLGLLFTIVIMAVLFAVSASADMGLWDLVPTGQCGENAYWTYDNTTGKLIISGSGRIEGDFLSCSIKELVIEEGLTNSGCFSFCDDLVSVELPKTVTNIDKYAFYSCDNLTELTIPDSVISIEEDAFAWCTNLTDIYYSGPVKNWNNISFSSGNDLLLNAKINFMGGEKCTMHSVTTLPGKDATCTSPGKTFGSYCEFCNMIFDEQQTIPATGHKWLEASEIPPTCTEIGFWGTECMICECV